MHIKLTYMHVYTVQTAAYTHVYTAAYVAISLNLISVFGVYYIVIFQQLSFLVPVFWAHEMSCGGKS